MPQILSVELDLGCAIAELLQNLLRTCWTWPCSAPKPPGTFSTTFSRIFFETLLNLTWLCNKTSHSISGTLWTCLALHQSLPDLLLNPIEPLPDLLRNLWQRWPRLQHLDQHRHIVVPSVKPGWEKENCMATSERWAVGLLQSPFCHQIPRECKDTPTKSLH